MANPVNHNQLESITLIRDYIDSFDAEKTPNKKEVDVTKDEQKRYTMGEK